MEKYNIHSLLNKFCLVVPEIQREYVWGSNPSVLTQFIQDLDEKLGKGETNIGFLYSYESGEEHYLIDGQQRFTTLILLLHYITVKEGAESHDGYVKLHHLDRYLSAFSYRVRSHTVSFLKNLLNSSAINSKMVEQQKWYKSIYANDITIHSMIGTLDVIDHMWDTLPNLNSNNVLHHVYFWYFDVKKTSQGEELYITMNSRGEKLTDSEQIKPRLIKKITNALDKETFGKKWDEWEEFFFDNKIRKDRRIESVDIAMNNMIRIILELVTQREHDKINAIEDAEKISPDDIESCMSSIKKLSNLSDGKYCTEIRRLFGDKEGDGNFIVLKALITEVFKGQTDIFEYERVYQTILNNVRRNKINNIDFLQFLACYREYKGTLYNFILKSKTEVVQKVVNGHELEKVTICADANDANVEQFIWSEQEKDLWNGEMKPLIAWSKQNGVFSFDEFKRISHNLHKLFNKSNNDGYTSDHVRQALLTCRLPYYPLNHQYFGFKRDEWKEIFSKNEQGFLCFLNKFDKVEKENISSVLDKLKNAYHETPDNPWAEFVKFDYFLDYCNTKHLEWTDSCGWFVVKNSWAKPISVRNMRLFYDLKTEYDDDINEWKINIWQSWDSCVYFQNDSLNIFFDIRYLRNKDNDTYFLKVDISKRNTPVEQYDTIKQDLLRFIPTTSNMEWKEEHGRYTWYPETTEELHNFISHITAFRE